MAQVTNPITFLKEVRTEMGKVIWPTRAETIRYTGVVIGVSVAIGAFIAGLDVTFVKLTELLIKK